MRVITSYVQTKINDPTDTTTHIRAHLECDTLSDLPSTATDIAGYTLEIGSDAHIIQDNTVHMMLSDGTWVIQDEASRMDVYTKAETNNLVDTEIQHQAGLQAVTDAAQDAAIDKELAALVYITDNAIQKNVMPKVKRIGTSNSNAQSTYTIGGITFTANADGTITVTRATTGTSQAVYLYGDSAAITIDDYCTGQYEFSTGATEPNFNIRLSQLDSGGYLYINTHANIPDRGTYTAINVSISVSASFSGTLTIKPMICAQSLWKISEQYTEPA